MIEICLGILLLYIICVGISTFVWSYSTGVKPNLETIVRWASIFLAIFAIVGLIGLAVYLIDHGLKN